MRQAPAEMRGGLLRRLDVASGARIDVASGTRIDVASGTRIDVASGTRIGVGETWSASMLS